jgi:predicted nuclease of restriction endonuclease-like (RecB) superfamily
LSNGKTNKQKVLELSNKGVELNKPEDILKTPMVFEFLGAKENKPLLEKELEYKLIRHIEDFLKVFASKYVYYIPDKQVLIDEVNSVLKDKKKLSKLFEDIDDKDPENLE